jgi:tetratricopeptide (TPR) repeat protein
MTYKTIFKGRLEFGSSKSYDKVLKMYQHRVENYYKSDILLKEEEIFDEASTSLTVPKFIAQGSEKSWKNTVSLLEYVAQFAVAGNFGAWMTEEGKVLMQDYVEPHGDRIAVQAFLEGRRLSQEEGRESEAMTALNRAIEKFERHAQAYERRGYVNFLLGNYDEAMEDYSKSINMAPTLPESYLGRANVYILRKEYDKAIADLVVAIKMSIPLQTIYWKCRRMKGECHMLSGDFKAGAMEMNLFIKRKHKKDEPNYKWLRWSHLQFGKCKLELGEYQEAIDAFTQALAIEEGEELALKSEILLQKGIAMQKAGKDASADWEKAAELGSEKAEAYLKQYA